MVLLLQLQYHIQVTPLSSNKCHSFNISTQKHFKSINRFSCTAFNILFNSFNFYDLKDLWQTQLADISTSLFNQFNHQDSLFSQLSRNRLFLLQQQELNPTSPLYLWTPLFDSFRSYQANYIASQLFLFYHGGYCLSFKYDTPLMNQIQEGITFLCFSLPTPFIRQYRKYLIKYNLFYLEQLTSPNGHFMIPWQSLCKWPFASYISTSKPLKFYKLLSHILTESHQPPPTSSL